ncbi:amino acid permease 6-like [Euphorbia lathyris]|uniref:amino acid permease 6-like n=1 Tax=Euphorbia lathyris TaxID=212925 RepID=UPI00331414C8
MIETDDDGRSKRTGTIWTASAHIITAVIGSGVLSLAWATAQLGWIPGIVCLVTFAVISGFASFLLADCYRFHGPLVGSRNSTYIQAVKSHLGGIKYKLCGLSQYINMVGVSIGYTITASISMAAITRAKCLHERGHEAGCHKSNNKFMIIFGITEVILSQTPNFHELSGLSILAAVMSFAYSTIGLALCIVKIAGEGYVRTSVVGAASGMEVDKTEKIWTTFQAIGDIAFAFAYSIVLIEIQDTLKGDPPENRVMKKASLLAISVTTIFYVLCGTLGYAAFGDKAPGNLLTGFGFYEPYWLVDFANVCIIVHLIGAYQVFCQPIFKLVEDKCSKRWPYNKFITKGHSIGFFHINFFKLIWRTGYVIITTVTAMMFPFFNSVLGLLGAVSFWPLTIYFPLEMYISQAKIGRFSFTWLWLRILSLACLLVSLLAAAACIRAIVMDLKTFKPFNSVS